MSTQKNEHNPSRLTPDKVGEGFRLLRSDERVQPGDEWWVNENTGWLEVGGRNMGVEASECLTIAIRRRITPPTDTTGGCPECGEKIARCPCSRIKGHSERCGFRIAASNYNPAEVCFAHEEYCCDRCNPCTCADTTGSGREGEPYKNDPAKRADYWKERYEIEHSQLEALRRDGERIELLEKWAKESPTGISFDWCRYAEEGQVLEHGFRFMRRHFLGDRKPTLRAAIDSAQRQEAK